MSTILTPSSPSSREGIIEIVSPIDHTPVGSVSMADRNGLDRVVASAKHAASLWGATPIKERVQVLFRFKHIVEQHIDELAKLISREHGKTVDESRAEIQRGIEVVEFATSIPNLGLDTNLEVSRGVDCITRHSALGVVAGVTPFNFPAMVPMWMFPTAIACGNAFILKPSEQVPLTARRIGHLLDEAGLPRDVFSVVHGGREIVEAMLDHPGIAALGFVGSSAVAQEVYRRGSNVGKRVLALGGAKNHLVVLPDAEPETTAANIVASAMGCSGQRCMAASVLVAVGNCDSIIKRMVAVANAIKVGEEMGPVISKVAKDRIVGYIDQAEHEGARLLLDGRKVAMLQGHYVGPTVIDGLGKDARCMREEIFGPVISILRVNTLDEALAIENRGPYGNAAAIYTTNGAAAHYFIERANAGMVGVNVGVPVPREPFPFGGWNQSKFGAGDLTGAAGVEFWTRTKKITQKWKITGAQNWMS